MLPQYQPANPEDEDDVVPDQHAAFGITRAMERRREAVWRDLGLEGLVGGLGHGGRFRDGRGGRGGGGGGQRQGRGMERRGMGMGMVGRRGCLR